MPFQGLSQPRYAIIDYAGWPGEQKHKRCLAKLLVETDTRSLSRDRYRIVTGV